MIGLDVHLLPAIATWITATFDIPALALRDLLHNIYHAL